MRGGKSSAADDCEPDEKRADVVGVSTERMMGFKGCTACGVVVRVEFCVTEGGLDVGGYGIDQVIDLHL